MKQPVAPPKSFYFCPLKCHLTLGTFICFQRVFDEHLEEGIGQVLQVSHDVPKTLLIHHFVTQDFLHKLFPALSNVCFVQDTNKDLIATDLIFWIVAEDAIGLVFVFKSLVISRSINDMFIVPLMYNSTQQVLMYVTGDTEEFHSFLSQKYAPWQSFCIPSTIWGELHNLHQVLQQMMNTRSKKLKKIQSIKTSVSSLTWCYIIGVTGK